MPTVWIVQNKPNKPGKRPFDYSAAKKFGKIKFVLDITDSELAQQPAIYKLKRELRHFQKDDSLVLMGEPSLTAAAAVVVSQYNFEVPLLIFDAKKFVYYRKVYKI